jgi:hypothetical protein
MKRQPTAMIIFKTSGGIFISKFTCGRSWQGFPDLAGVPLVKREENNHIVQTIRMEFSAIPGVDTPDT